MNNIKELEIFAELLMHHGENCIQWQEGSKSEFFPAEQRIVLPTISKDVLNTLQLGYICMNICQLLKSTPKLYAECKELGISDSVYMWLNQIWGEVTFRAEYPGTRAALNVLYDIIKNNTPDVDRNSSFFMKFYAHDKLAVPAMESGDGTYFAKIWEIMEESEKELSEDIWRMMSARDFKDVALKLQKLFVALESQQDVTQSGGHPQRQEVLSSEIATVLSSISNATMGKVVKKFDAAEYGRIALASVFVDSLSSIALHDTDFIKQSINKPEIDVFLNHCEKVAIDLCNEFDTYKSAHSLSERRTDEQDQLDENHLFEYKISDTIWIEEVKERAGQSHCVMLMLDFSSSMIGPKISLALEETIILGKFCRMRGIPYRIYAFSDSHRSHSDIEIQQDGFASPYSTMKIYELLTSASADSDNKKMERILGLAQMTDYTVGGMTTEFAFSKTPLFNALLLLPELISNFIYEQADRLCLFIMSDGESHPVAYVKDGAIKETLLDTISYREAAIIDVYTAKEYQENESSILRLVTDQVKEMACFKDGMTIVGYTPLELATKTMLKDAAAHMYPTDDVATDSFEASGIATISPHEDPRALAVFVAQPKRTAGAPSPVESFYTVSGALERAKVFGRAFIELFA